MRSIINTLIIIFCTVIGAHSQTENVEIKDSDGNVLMKVNDEGSIGSIFLERGDIPSETQYKIYNHGGNLYWDRLKLGSEYDAGGWRVSGMNLYTKNLNNKIGIGTSGPVGKLHVLQQSSEIALRVDDVLNDDSPFIIDDTGKVGIGNSSPTEMLHVEGNTKVTGDILLNGEIIPNGTTGLKGQVLASDGAGNIFWNNISNFKYSQQIFVDGAFTIPPNVHEVLIEVWSGGGGGSEESGGGGSGYIMAIIDVTPGEELDIYIGEGGEGATASTDGGNGGTSYVYQGSNNIHAHSGYGATSLIRGTGGFGGSVNIPGARYIGLQGQDGQATSVQYNQKNATTFIEITKYGNGGDGGNSSNTGGNGAYTVIDETGSPTYLQVTGTNGNNRGGGGGSKPGGGYSGGYGAVVISWN